MFEHIWGGVVISESLMKIYWLDTQQKDNGQLIFRGDFIFNATHTLPDMTETNWLKPASLRPCFKCIRIELVHWWYIYITCKRHIGGLGSDFFLKKLSPRSLFTDKALWQWQKTSALIWWMRVPIGTLYLNAVIGCPVLYRPSLRPRCILSHVRVESVSATVLMQVTF